VRTASQASKGEPPISPRRQPPRLRTRSPRLGCGIRPGDPGSRRRRRLRRRRALREWHLPVLDGEYVCGRAAERSDSDELRAPGPDHVRVPPRPHVHDEVAPHHLEAPVRIHAGGIVEIDETLAVVVERVPKPQDPALGRGEELAGPKRWCAVGGDPSRLVEPPVAERQAHLLHEVLQVPHAVHRVAEEGALLQGAAHEHSAVGAQREERARMKELAILAPHPPSPRGRTLSSLRTAQRSLDPAPKRLQLTGTTEARIHGSLGLSVLAAFARGFRGPAAEPLIRWAAM